MVSDEVIQRVKDENDIIDIISETVKLKKAGRNYVGLCPFHSEKTPSFSVSQEKQIYKCFGCGEAGNVITFLMKTRKLTFLDSLKLLGERVNISIDSQDEKSPTRDRYEKMYSLNVEAAKFFRRNLMQNKKAMEYLLNRGITNKLIANFGLGFAPDNWSSLLKSLKAKGYTELDLLNLGLIIKSPKGTYYDRFRNRVMYPVFDYKGKVIGFGGRVMDDTKPKYLNSPETPIFKKGINLYGMNFTIKDLKEDFIIIVEGYMDCIALHQCGITNAVASLGTALTVNQAKLIKRYVGKVVIAYDADVAGEAATLRGLEILKQAGLDIRVLTVPEGKDPDEYIRNNGKEAFVKLLAIALPLIDYRIKKVREGIDIKKPENLVRYVERVLQILADLDSVERDVYIKKISEETRIKDQALYDMLNSKIKDSVKKEEGQDEEVSLGQKLYLEPAYLKAERTLIKLMLNSQYALEYAEKHMEADQFAIESHKSIFGLILAMKDMKPDARKKSVELKLVDPISTSEWVNIEESEAVYDKDNIDSYVDDCIKEIKKYKIEESKKEIMSKIRQLEAEGKLQESMEMAKELIKIQKKGGSV
ncbi:MAG: DNA primase [Clostridiaceae bacterium]